MIKIYLAVKAKVLYAKNFSGKNYPGELFLNLGSLRNHYETASRPLAEKVKRWWTPWSIPRLNALTAMAAASCVSRRSPLPGTGGHVRCSMNPGANRQRNWSINITPSTERKQLKPRGWEIKHNVFLNSWNVHKKSSFNIKSAFPHKHKHMTINSCLMWLPLTGTAT